MRPDPPSRRRKIGSLVLMLLSKLNLGRYMMDVPIDAEVADCLVSGHSIELTFVVTLRADGKSSCDLANGGLTHFKGELSVVGGRLEDVKLRIRS